MEQVSLELQHSANSLIFFFLLIYKKIGPFVRKMTK
jgi:hypothetical protein